MTEQKWVILMIFFLKEKYNVIILYNDFYDTRNNNASIFVAKSYLKNTYICSADNYFIDKYKNIEGYYEELANNSSIFME